MKSSEELKIIAENSLKKLQNRYKGALRNLKGTDKYKYDRYVIQAGLKETDVEPVATAEGVESGAEQEATAEAVEPAAEIIIFKNLFDLLTYLIQDHHKKFYIIVGIFKFIEKFEYFNYFKSYLGIDIVVPHIRQLLYTEGECKYECMDKIDAFSGPDSIYKKFKKGENILTINDKVLFKREGRALRGVIEDLKMDKNTPTLSKYNILTNIITNIVNKFSSFIFCYSA